VPNDHSELSALTVEAGAGRELIVNGTVPTGGPTASVTAQPTGRAHHGGAAGPGEVPDLFESDLFELDLLAGAWAPRPGARGDALAPPDPVRPGLDPDAGLPGAPAGTRCPEAGGAAPIRADEQDWRGWQEVIDWLWTDGDGDDGDPPVGVGEYLAAGPD
jgi:hypothetical protein